jgi:hypothetical protein
MVGAAQVAERFRLGRAVAYARLGGLVRLGLLKHARIFHGAPGVYLATRIGLASVDLELPSARVDLRTYAHDLELSWLVLGLEREFGRDWVRTEREMRALDTSPGRPAGERPSFAISLTGARGQLQLTRSGYPRLHFSDCAVIGASADGGRLLAVELERTAKGQARLRRILAGYVAARHIGSVRYYVCGERVRNLVEDVVTAHSADTLIEVRESAPLARDHAALDPAA